MYDLKPRNKHIWLRDMTQDSKLGDGTLWAPGNMTNQFRLAVVLGVAECDEGKDIAVGDMVLYDTLGAYDHRLGNATYRTTKVMNVVAVVMPSEKVTVDPVNGLPVSPAGKFVYDPEDFSPRRA